ncbi:hypothetical protein EST62_13080 [Chlorobaculum sp. 24CR]|uniref:hypothetical protein n=1 Tax=Chlorobaculum sp. 24CR TaxID=2508878 RepID=UPI00100BBCD9|nr:hypothetical protein [Chlorobaculum sp. 24CR]RXK80033.1 hypothetical protein EST62_13080 [Chlorobaculum sp. 24CR]
MSNMFFVIQLAIESIQTTLNKWSNFRPEKGVITMEYGLLGLLIAAALVGSAQALKDVIADLFTTAINAFP